LLRLRGASPITFIVEEEERFVVTVIEVRNRQWPTDTSSKRIELLWSLLCEVQYSSVERIILEILEKTSMKFICAALGCERHITNLRKFSIVIESCNFQFCNSLGRGIRVCASCAVEDIRR